MFRTICCTLPFSICLCWFVTFALETRRNDPAKRSLTVFLGTCSVLYLCHAFYFNGGLPTWAESLWALCSLSVYPLYFVYICHLTCRPLSLAQTALLLLPGLVVATAILLLPGADTDTARRLLNAAQIVFVLYFGQRRLQKFDEEVANVYADTEGRDTSAIRMLLIAFVITSLLSLVANVLGKSYFASNDWLVLAAFLPFTILLYALSYIGYTRHFTQKQFLDDTTGTESTATHAEAEEMDESELGRKIEELMGNGYYLNKNLKVNDLASETNSCRTYVSNYINKAHECSFSDYVNLLRVEHAKRLLQENRDMKMTVVADMSGFTSMQSFYRSFRKFVGMAPVDWLKGLSQQQES